MYHCVSINELLSAMDKTSKVEVLQKVVVRKTLYSMIVMDLYLRKLSYCFQLASNDIHMYMLELLILFCSDVCITVF